MERFKRFLDRVVGAPPQGVKEAIKYDETRLDQSIARMLAVKDEFADVVALVVRDIGSERRQRRAHAKTTSRAGKT